MKNDSLEVGKFFAILSVVIAHYISKDISVYGPVFERIGTFGVPFFLFLAGYFYNIEKYGFINFFKNKFNGIVIPWIFTGSIVYLVIKKHFVILEWLQWILGIGTYLYYLTVLFLLFLLFSLSFIRNNKYILYFFVLINAVSLVLTYKSHYSIYSYINILNWIGFFSIGILLKGKITEFLGRIKGISIILLLFFIAIIYCFSMYIEDGYSGYFSQFSYILEIIGILIILLFSSFKFFTNPLILKISQYSFTIYLIHFLFFPLKKIFPTDLIFEFLGPVIIICLITLIIHLTDRLLSKFNFCQSLFRKLLGIR